jgi:prepilin-type processing-associated H-X9-DG protein
MKYLAYMNILFGDNHVRTVEIGKKGAVIFFETLADNVFRHNYSMMQI